LLKSYLQQSNQLFVTRVLGLSGYDAGPSWSIRIVANVDGTTVGLNAGVTKLVGNFHRVISRNFYFIYKFVTN
jgi:hypothetical protein